MPKHKHTLPRTLRKRKLKSVRKTRKASNTRQNSKKDSFIQKGGRVIDKKVTFKLGDNKTKLSLSFKHGQLNYILVKLGLLDSIPFTHPEKLENKFIGWHLFYYNVDKHGVKYDDFVIDYQKMDIQQRGTLRAYPNFLNSSFDLSFKKHSYWADVIKSIKFDSSHSKSHSIDGTDYINLLIDKQNKIIVVVNLAIYDREITPENNRKLYEFLNHIYHTAPKLFGHKSVKSYTLGHNTTKLPQELHPSPFSKNNNTQPLLPATQNSEGNGTGNTGNGTGNGNNNNTGNTGNTGDPEPLIVSGKLVLRDPYSKKGYQFYYSSPNNNV